MAVVLKGKVKNQTEKKRFTVIVQDEYGYDIVNKTVEAEGVREAVCKVFSFLVDPNKNNTEV